jgi:phthiocerol/phenolphthiocerol synthesis type-I polyketide synthase B
MTASLTSGERVPVALVGIGCRYPGGIADPVGFWRFLVEGRDAIAEIPRDRIDLEHYYDAAPATPGRIMTRWGGFLERLQEFDPGFFGMSPREAERLDPQQRLILETGWEALEDAGQNVAALEGSHTGIFIGQWLSDFESRLFADPEAVDFYMTTGSGRYATSGRLSYLLGLRGPSLTIDTACSSSLVAVHLAVRSLRSGESTLALAGGVNTILQPHISVAYSQSRMMAPDGRCKFGDAAGDGYVRSEGAGLIVLKRLDQAVKDGDRIYAVIRGSATNNDGRSSGSMGTPSRLGQEELLRAAYKDAEVSPGEVGYVEAHGTGTRAGDPVELGALSAVLSEGRTPGRRAFVGSVKTNFGHTEGAAGIAGLIKAALCVHHGAVPASLHCKQLNPNIPWEQIPLEIARKNGEWVGEGPRFAGVSAFGIAGTNAHVVLEGAPARRAAAPVSSAPRGSSLLPLSTRSPEALRALAARYAELLAAPGSEQLSAVCANAAIRRTALENRAVFVASDSRSMVDALGQFAAGDSAWAQGSVPERGSGSPRIAFVVPGQGAQWVGMARQLSADEPVYLQALRECDTAARKYVDWSLLEELHRDLGSADYKLDRIDVIQPILVAMAIAYAAWLRSVGVRPDALVGHSMGEVGAAYLAGALSLDQAMRIICRRSALMRQTSGQGAMAMVDLSMAEAEKRLAGRQARVSVAVSNSPRSCVISGEPAAVNEVIAECERDGVFCRLVKVDVASHSPQMDGPSAQLRAELDGLTPAAATVPIYSTVLAGPAAGPELDAGYWGRNMRQPVRFTDTIGKLLEDGITIFVELGPHPVLVPAIQQTAQARGGDSSAIAALACGRREEPEQLNMLGVVANLWTAGVSIDWNSLAPLTELVPLPNYPWQRERHWVRQAEARAAGGGAAGLSAPELPEKQQPWLHCLRWRVVDAASRGPVENGGRPWLIVSDDAVFADGVVAALRSRGQEASATSPAFLGRTLEALGSTPLLPKGIVLLVPTGPDSAFAPIATVQACSTAFSRTGEAQQPKLWIVTLGAQAIGTHPRSVAVDQAPLWGAGRVIAEEHPGMWGGVIDLDPKSEVAQSADELTGELLGPDGEDQVAWRGGLRHVLRLSALEAAEQSGTPARWRSDGAYLITGGLGAIGLRIAAGMVARGARRIVLLGRTALPPRMSWNDIDAASPAGKRVAAVRALEMAGATVHLLTADVSDSTDLERALRGYASEAWPPIVGVVHAAGILGSKLVADMDRATFDSVMSAKLSGARNLDRLLPDVGLFILFSSTSVMLGIPGMSNYAAANAGLDAIAAARRARGVHGLSIQWGPWSSTGMFAGEIEGRYAAEFARQGIQPLAAADGVSLYEWLTGFPGSAVAVMPVDWAKFRSARGGRDHRLFVERIGEAGQGAGEADAFAARLAAAESVHARRQMLESAVRETAARVLRISPRKLDSRRPLGTMGLDSLMAIELRNRLEALLGRSLSATLAWNYPTVEALAAFLSGDPGVAPAPLQKTAVLAAEPDALDVGLEEIIELSDEDVARELRAGGRGS